MVKIIAVIALAVIAVTMICATAVIVKKVQDVSPAKFEALVEKALAWLKAITVTIAIIAGGSAAGVLLSSCSAKRSITVQGTVIKCPNSDSTRVIISSQESYVGARRK